MTMQVSMFTTNWDGKTAKARTQHQDTVAVLTIERGGESVTIFGPMSAKEAFDTIVTLFNDAHPDPTPEEIQAVADDEPFPF